MTEYSSENPESKGPGFFGINLLDSAVVLQRSLTKLLDHAILDDTGLFAMHPGKFIHVEFDGVHQTAEITNGDALVGQVDIDKMDCTSIRLHWPETRYPLDPIILELNRTDNFGNVATIHIDPALLSDFTLLSEEELGTYQGPVSQQA